MAKLTFNSVVYLKSTLEKVYVRAIITYGQKKTYKLSNGMKVCIDELLTELPVRAELPIEPEQPEPEQVQPVSIPEQPQSQPEQPQTEPEHPKSTPTQPQKKAAKKPTKKA